MGADSNDRVTDGRDGPRDNDIVCTARQIASHVPRQRRQQPQQEQTTVAEPVNQPACKGRDRRDHEHEARDRQANHDVFVKEIRRLIIFRHKKRKEGFLQLLGHAEDKQRDARVDDSRFGRSITAVEAIALCDFVYGPHASTTQARNLLCQRCIHSIQLIDKAFRQGVAGRILVDPQIAPRPQADRLFHFPQRLGDTETGQHNHNLDRHQGDRHQDHDRVEEDALHLLDHKVGVGMCDDMTNGLAFGHDLGAREPCACGLPRRDRHDRNQPARQISGKSAILGKRLRRHCACWTRQDLNLAEFGMHLGKVSNELVDPAQLVERDADGQRILDIVSDLQRDAFGFGKNKGLELIFVLGNRRQHTERCRDQHRECGREEKATPKAGVETSGGFAHFTPPWLASNSASACSYSAFPMLRLVANSPASPTYSCSTLPRVGAVPSSPKIDPTSRKR